MPRLAPPLLERPTSAAYVLPPEKAEAVTLGDALAQWERYLQSSDRISRPAALTRTRTRMPPRSWSQRSPKVR